MSNWPEPTREADEPPRWLGRAAAFVVAVAAIMILAPRDGAQSWRLPDFDMPEFSMPNISMLDFSSPAPSGDTPPATASIAEGAMPPMPDAPIETEGDATVQTMPFDACVQTMANLSDSMGQPIFLLEDTADRRVAVFKFLDSDLTVTCSRADGTLTVRRRGETP